MKTPEFKKAAVDWIDLNGDEFYEASDILWKFPELGMEEHKSSALLMELLEKNGFAVEKGVAEMPTAFIATFGSGKPVIGLSAESDRGCPVSPRKYVRKRSRSPKVLRVTGAAIIYLV